MPHLLPKVLGNCKDGTWTKAQALASLRAFPNGLDRIIAFKGFGIHFGPILFIFELSVGDKTVRFRQPLLTSS